MKYYRIPLSIVICIVALIVAIPYCEPLIGQYSVLTAWTERYFGEPHLLITTKGPYGERFYELGRKFGYTPIPRYGCLRFAGEEHYNEIMKNWLDEINGPNWRAEWETAMQPYHTQVRMEEKKKWELYLN